MSRIFDRIPVFRAPLGRPARDPINQYYAYVVGRPGFQRGDRVIRSDLLTDGILGRKSGAGVVTGFSRDGECIWVLRDGVRERECWHKSFWRVVIPTVPAAIDNQAFVPLTHEDSGAGAAGTVHTVTRIVGRDEDATVEVK